HPPFAERVHPRRRRPAGRGGTRAPPGRQAAGCSRGRGPDRRTARGPGPGGAGRLTTRLTGSCSTPVRPAGHRRPGRAQSIALRPTRKEPDPMKALSTVAVALGIPLGALIIIPLVVLAGLFVWLKLTEEDDEEALELEQEGI